jgi:hypothetical protein
MSAASRPITAAVDRVAADGALILPGTLVYLLGVGWLTLLLGVASVPRSGDLAFTGASIFSSGAFPWNALALIGCVVATLAAVVILIAAGESQILDRLSGSTPRPDRIWPMAGAIAVACIPALLAMVGLVLASIPAAEAAYANPDVTDPFWAQLGRAVAGWLLLVGIAAIVGQAFGATALREVASGTGGLRSALGRAFGKLGVAPLRLLSVAAIGTALIFALTVAIGLLVALLWEPIVLRLVSGLVLDPVTIGLLMALVGIWLLLITVGGMAQAILSAWWSVVLEEIR